MEWDEEMCFSCINNSGSYHRWDEISEVRPVPSRPATSAIPPIFLMCMLLGALSLQADKEGILLVDTQSITRY